MKPKFQWIITVGTEQIYIDPNVNIDWDITEWDEGCPEVYAIRINGVRLEFESIVTIERQYSDGGIDKFPY